MVSPPSHARPSHLITTPRVIIRSAVPSDAEAFHIVRTDPLNNPHGGVRDPNLLLETQRQRLAAQKASTAEGKNAFMVVVLKDGLEGNDREELRVHDGVLIGMTGFNAFPTVVSGEMSTLVGDTGILVDHRYGRKGYALEAQCAVIDYGFQKLGVQEITLDTAADNVPFRGLMAIMGMRDVEVARVGEDGEEVGYQFGMEKWEEGKRGMKEAGKWYL